MITEDQLEQLAIQWFQDTGWYYLHGAVIAPEGVAAEREDFRAVARRRDAMPGQVSRRIAMSGRVLDVLTKPKHRMGRPFRAWNLLGDGTQGLALGCRVMPRWGGRNEQMQRSGARRRRPTKKGDLMIRSGGGGRATCKGCLQVQMERNQKP
jgi:type I restriction enzyme R subunit